MTLVVPERPEELIEIDLCGTAPRVMEAAEIVPGADAGLATSLPMKASDHKKWRDGRLAPIRFQCRSHGFGGGSAERTDRATSCRENRK
ncbi:hypothetical protein JQ596_20955 [Bradyrhizobium manausense]|uniref:hypothetical protein n=1 Tax=Bradyrhizobium arachidis TaxID=858423 RepID=UPI0021636721|nr:hypothetical protein [Bradyrhizobium arachidis]MBR0828006.1 hypothetical protein [Bradyrhizobium manausense]UVO32869.1 hypothetical protein KUF59_20755 [Bradyrhizobium arachidis]